ncbi:MAG TPA: phosphotransferase [Candidatus Megaira endosymbiont of Hartmannula sinica]|nr:phosphotransferase [Candidatus Megaera endosymbiont of Hartmannula sinica]
MNENINETINHTIKDIFAAKNIKVNSIKKLKGDAGDRRYYRVTINNNMSDCLNPDLTKIVVDYSFVQENIICSFIEITNFLARINISVPAIFLHDKEKKILVLDDLGDTHIKDIIITGKENLNTKDFLLYKQNIYKHIIDLIIQIQSKTSKGLDISFYTIDNLIDELSVFLEYYIQYKVMSRNDSGYKSRWINPILSSKFNMIWQTILSKQFDFSSTFTMRDMHVENMMVKQNIIDNSEQVVSLKSFKDISLIDFQDGMVGSPIYDIASIIDDIRINNEESIRSFIINYYSEKNDFNPLEVELNYKILSLQRNMRIAGIFSKYYIEGKDHYEEYIVKAENNINRLIKDQTFVELRRWCIQQNLFNN